MDTHILWWTFQSDVLEHVWVSSRTRKLQPSLAHPCDAAALCWVATLSFFPPKIIQPVIPVSFWRRQPWFFFGFGTLSTTVSGWGCWKTERGGDESAQTPGIHSDGLNRQVFGGNNAHLGRAISVRWETVAFGVYREYFGVCSDNVVVSKSWIFWFLTCLFSIAAALLLYLVTSKGTSPGWKSRSLCKLLPTYQRKAWRNHYTVHLHLGVSENSVPLNPMVNDHYPY